jgi:hypothetical protein
MQKILGYDAINDFRMKTVQFQTKLKEDSKKKEETIKKMIAEAKIPNDFYNIYKVKGVESINKHLLKIIGQTDKEWKIEGDILDGNFKIACKNQRLEEKQQRAKNKQNLDKL